MRNELIATMSALVLLAGCGGGGSDGSGTGGKDILSLIRPDGSGSFDDTGSPSPTAPPGSQCSADSSEPNDSASAATGLPLNQPANLNFCDDASDFFRIVVPAGSGLLLETSQLQTRTDTVMTASVGASQVGFDDDGGSGLASRLALDSSQVGGQTVIVQVTQFDSAVTGNDTGYVLSASAISSGGLPDLTLGDATVANPDDQRRFEFSIEVANEGSAPASADVGFYLSVDENIDPATDNFVSSTQTPVIAPGESATVQGVVQLPAEFGERTFGIVVDDRNAVQESDESNNSDNFARMIVGTNEQNCIDDFNEQDDTPALANSMIPPADLSLDHCTDADDWLRFNATAGSQYRVYTTRLSFNADTTLEVQDTGGTTIINNDDFDSASDSLFSALAFQAANTESLNVRIGSFSNATGRYRNYAVHVLEDDSRPDLVASITNLTAGPLTAGSTASITVQVANLGLTDAPATVTRPAVFVNELGRLGDRGIGPFFNLVTIDVPAIPAGQIATVTASFTVPNASATVEFLTAADDDDVVDEAVNTIRFNVGNFVSREITGGTATKSASPITGALARDLVRGQFVDANAP